MTPNGDPARGGPFLSKEGRSGYFVQHNRGKKGICVNIKTPEGHDIVADLIRKSDVLVENYAPGVIGRMGFDYAHVKELNPKIVMCSISAFGQTGPLAHEPGFDFLGAAYAGITSMGGEPDGSPYFAMTAMGDVSTGAHACGAVCAALLYRERTGRGQHLDLSLLDTYFHYHEAAVEAHSLTKGQFQPTRSGKQSWYALPCGVFKAKNRYFIIIATLDHHFRGLCCAMGKPELFEDPRFRLNANRLINVEALVAEIEAGLRRCRVTKLRWRRSGNIACRMRRCSRWPRRSTIRICASAAPCAPCTIASSGISMCRDSRSAFPIPEAARTASADAR